MSRQTNKAGSPLLSPHRDPLPRGEGDDNRTVFAGWRGRLSPTGNTGDSIFRALIFAVALLMVLIVAAMIIALASHSTLSIRQFGFSFIAGREWNPIKGQFGALAFIYGTLVSS
ncbi:MAG: hypothetical protein M3R52_07365, partial [Acidobacteriota bacterium]|nr:hypothetical protein [Acidobacteriota bacterium]